eukprot:EG_transcript_25056
MGILLSLVEKHKRGEKRVWFASMQLLSRLPSGAVKSSVEEASGIAFAGKVQCNYCLHGSHGVMEHTREASFLVFQQQFVCSAGKWIRPKKYRIVQSDLFSVDFLHI